MEINPVVLGHLLSWWERLEDDHASRAVLKRAHSLTAVALSVPYQRLYRQLLANGCWTQVESPEQSGWNDKLALVVGILVHVRGEVEGNRQQSGRLLPAAAMSRREAGDERPVVSPLRFMRLLQSPDLESLFTGLRRVLPLVGSSIDVKALAKDLLYWGDTVKKCWAYQYDWPEENK